LQAALLFDRPQPLNLDDAAKKFLELEAVQTGTKYNVVEAKQNLFYRLYGSNDMMVTLERIDGQANRAVFNASLASPITRMATPDVEERLARHQSHVLVGAHHGVFGPMPQHEEFLKKIDFPQAGNSLPQFRQRLRICGLLGLLCHDLGQASLVHWTQADHLMKGETFAAIALQPPPGPLHVHPRLFQADPTMDGRHQVEILTFGVSHFLDRELHLLPSSLPWAEVYVGAMAFVSLALAPNGYVIPDNNTFSPEDNSVAYKVRHIPVGQKSGQFEGPLYQLDLIHSAKHNFTKHDYIPPEKTFDDQNPPKDVLSALGSKAEETLKEWQAKRQTAEAAGGRFTVKYDPDAPPPSSPSRPVFGKRTSLH
jgi:hypothetical protein